MFAMNNPTSKVCGLLNKNLKWSIDKTFSAFFFTLLLWKKYTYQTQVVVHLHVLECEGIPVGIFCLPEKTWTRTKHIF